VIFDNVQAMVEMEVMGVRVEMSDNQPIVLLREREGRHRVLPIFIGPPEATAIALALDQVETARPMTHDLMKEILEELQAEVPRIVVTDLIDQTFYAAIQLQVGDQTHEVSSRPSDAIALAVRVGAPVYASESVLDEAAQTVEEVDSEAVVDEFRQFLDNVDPDDFNS
jgi:bifunctional DNase/RNase